MKNLPDYKTNSFDDISDNVPFGQRGASDALKKAKFMYSEYMQGKSGICYDDIARIRENRNYAAGMQSIDRYQKILIGVTQDGQAEKEGHYNINWDVFSVAPKYKSIIVSKIMSVDHNIFIDTIDQMSQNEKLTKEVDDKLNIIFKQKLDELGISNKTEMLPDTLEEYEMIKKELGIRLGVEADIEALIYFTYDYSNWKQIKERLVGDFVDNGIAGAKDYVNPQTGMVELRYVDIERAIAQFSKEPDFKNSEYFGEFIDYTISDLKPYFKQDELPDIAEAFRGWGGNDAALQFSYEGGKCNFNNYKVLVMDFEYKSVDYDNGVPVIMWNRAKWIVGTEKVFDYGMQRNIPRPDNFEACSSYHFRRGYGKSIMERCKPNFDSLCLTWYKLQNLKHQARIPGLAIEFSSLMNISIGNAKEPMDLLKIYRATGDVLYKATTHRGIVNNNGMRPIQELQGGMGAYLQQLIQTFELDLQFISELSGVDRISAISKTPGSETPVGTTELAVSATDNALNPLYLAYIDVKEATARNITFRVQDIIRFDKEGRSAYKEVIGETSIKMLQSKEGIVNRRLGIKIEARPSANELADIKDALNVAMQAGKNGIPLITFDDYMMIKDLLKTPNGIKQARQLLSFKMKKRAEEQQANAEKAIMAQKQGEAQVLQLKQQGDMAQKKFETDEAIRLEYFKALIGATITAEDQAEREAKMKMFEAALQYGQQAFSSAMGAGQQPATA